jgi:penicillin-binding protein 1A
MSAQTAFKMIYMLKGGVEEEGGSSQTLSYALKNENEIGGKTGTSNNGSDGWYIGITKNLVSGGWVGGDERSIRYRDWYLGQGGRTARPMWEKYMLQVYADGTLDYKKGAFRIPEGHDSIDCKAFDTPQDTPESVPDQWQPNN